MAAAEEAAEAAREQAAEAIRHARIAAAAAERNARELQAMQVALLHSLNSACLADAACSLKLISSASATVCSRYYSRLQ